MLPQACVHESSAFGKSASRSELVLKAGKAKGFSLKPLLREAWCPSLISVLTLAYHTCSDSEKWQGRAMLIWVVLHSTSRMPWYCRQWRTSYPTCGGTGAGQLCDQNWKESTTWIHVKVATACWQLEILYQDLELSTGVRICRQETKRCAFVTCCVGVLPHWSVAHWGSVTSSAAARACMQPAVGRPHCVVDSWRAWERGVWKKAAHKALQTEAVALGSVTCSSFLPENSGAISDWSSLVFLDANVAEACHAMPGREKSDIPGSARANTHLDQLVFHCLNNEYGGWHSRATQGVNLFWVNAIVTSSLEACLSFWAWRSRSLAHQGMTPLVSGTSCETFLQAQAFFKVSVGLGAQIQGRKTT